MARLVMKPREQNRPLEMDETPAAMQNDIDMDSSDDEQQQALGYLWKSMQEETKNDTEEEEDEEEELDEPWDYWQLGYDTPRKHDLQDFYYFQYSHNNPFQLSHSGRKVRMQEIQNESVTLKPIGWSDVDKSAEEERSYLQRELPTACFAHSTFAHATIYETWWRGFYLRARMRSWRIVSCEIITAGSLEKWDENTMC
jgi:hypothetical protein